MPLEWIDFKEAVRVYHLGQVAYTCGVPLYQIRGGYNAISGKRSILEINSIVATHGELSRLKTLDLNAGDALVLVAVLVGISPRGAFTAGPSTPTIEQFLMPGTPTEWSQ